MSMFERFEAGGNRQQPAKGGQQSRESLRKDPFVEIKTSAHRRLIEEMGKTVVNTRGVPQQEVDPGCLSARLEVILNELAAESGALVSRTERLRLTAEVLAEAVGYGPIQPLVEDELVSEIMVNGPDQVCVERNGKIYQTDISFRDDEHLLTLIRKIVAPLGRRIDDSSPMVDARLTDGSRVNAIIPPLSLTGPILTIRKFARDLLTIDQLIALSTLTKEMAFFLEMCVKGGVNILVSGGTGTGKTTMLNLLSAFVPGDERIITIEDAAELQLCQKHVIRLETRPPNLEGKGAVVTRDLVRNALRMRPDRIVVGEVRGGEALDMLQAMNTGHDGSMTTGHANSPRDMLSRLETMVLMAGMDLPVKAIREQISSAIDLIIHQSRFQDGSRKITHITEVQGMESGVITLQDIFVFMPGGVTPDGKAKGHFKATGLRPKFLQKLESAGVPLPPVGQAVFG